MGKRKFYFPPKAEKKTPTDIHVSDDVKAELRKLADDYVKQTEAENINNYIAFTLEALSRRGWTGKTRLNRFLSVLTEVSDEAVNATDSAAYANEIKKRMTEKGVSAFLEDGEPGKE